MTLRILITSVGNLAMPLLAQEIKKHVPRSFTFGIDVREDAHGLYFCNDFAIAPFRSDPQFFPFILEIIKNHQINVLWPLSTEDQNYFAAKKYDLENHQVHLVSSSIKALEIANNKEELYVCLKEQFPTIIPSFFDASQITLESAIKLFNGNVIFKPKEGKGGQGIYLYSEDVKQVNANDKKFLVKDDAFYTSLQLEDYLITEYLPGEEYSVDCFSTDQNFKYGVVRKRHTSIGGMGILCEVIAFPEALKISSEIVNYLNLNYINNIQFKKNANGALKLLEINPRIPANLPLTIHAGAPMIADSLRNIQGNDVSTPQINIGAKSIRYYETLFL